MSILVRKPSEAYRSKIALSRGYTIAGRRLRTKLLKEFRSEFGITCEYNRRSDRVINTILNFAPISNRMASLRSSTCRIHGTTVVLCWEKLAPSVQWEDERLQDQLSEYNLEVVDLGEWNMDLEAPRFWALVIGPRDADRMYETWLQNDYPCSRLSEQLIKKSPTAQQIFS